MTEPEEEDRGAGPVRPDPVRPDPVPPEAVAPDPVTDPDPSEPSVAVPEPSVGAPDSGPASVARPATPPDDAASAAPSPPAPAVPPAARPVRRRRLAVAYFLAWLLTALVYIGLGPGSTAFDFQVTQANNLLHGHVDLVEEYSRNLNVLERVLYDGEGFCLPVNDPRGPDAAAQLENPRITEDCRTYMQHSVGPALLLLPFVAIWGLSVSTPILFSLFGALAAPLALAIARRFTSDRRTLTALTALFAVGTTFWYSAADGGVWHVAHTTAVVFLLAAIWAAVVRGSPVLAGAFIGAAFMCRPTTLLAGTFALVWFADRWYLAREGRLPWIHAIDLRPLLGLALGALPFVATAMAFNYVRFGSLLESGYNYSEELYQIGLAWRWPYGFFDLRYLPRHPAVFFQAMPTVLTTPPFIRPSWAGLATWVTTPAILLVPFIHLRRYRRLSIGLGVLLAASCTFLLARAVAIGLGNADLGRQVADLGLDMVPFWLAIGSAILLSLIRRDRLVIAAWAAIVAIAIADWSFAATGWAQWGYRYALDFMPFLYLLIVVAVAPKVRRLHLVLIGIGIVVNLWGVLSIMQLSRVNALGLSWIGF